MEALRATARTNHILAEKEIAAVLSSASSAASPGDSGSAAAVEHLTSLVSRLHDSVELNGTRGRQQVPAAQLRVCDRLLFDLDDTLYPANSGISADVMKNIQDYMVQKLGIDKSVSLELCVLLYKQYGTTMAGLRALGYQFDFDDFHGFVHGRLAYEKLNPDLVLRNILFSLPIRKVVFTNGDRIHASRALQRLGIEGCFEGVVCFETLNPTSPAPAPAPAAVPANEAKIFDIMKHLADPQPGVELPKSPILCKPSIDAMLHALELANINPLTTVFFDDSIRNIQAGKQIGMHTVLVGTSQRIKGADHALESIHNLKEALPELWEEAVKDEDVRSSSKVGIETSVIRNSRKVGIETSVIA